AVLGKTYLSLASLIVSTGSVVILSIVSLKVDGFSILVVTSRDCAPSPDLLLSPDCVPSSDLLPSPSFLSSPDCEPSPGFLSSPEFVPSPGCLLSSPGFSSSFGFSVAFNSSCISFKRSKYFFVCSSLISPRSPLKYSSISFNSSSYFSLSSLHKSPVTLLCSSSM